MAFARRLQACNGFQLAVTNLDTGVSDASSAAVARPAAHKAEDEAFDSSYPVGERQQDIHQGLVLQRQKALILNVQLCQSS